MSNLRASAGWRDILERYDSCNDPNPRTDLAWLSLEGWRASTNLPLDGLKYATAFIPAGTAGESALVRVPRIHTTRRVNRTTSVLSPEILDLITARLHDKLPIEDWEREVEPHVKISRAGSHVLNFATQADLTRWTAFLKQNPDLVSSLKEDEGVYIKDVKVDYTTKYGDEGSLRVRWIYPSELICEAGQRELKAEYTKKQAEASDAGTVLLSRPGTG